MFFAKPLQRSNLCASHRQRRWLTHGELVLYTDGVTESTNRAGQELGVGGLEEYFKESIQLPPGKCLQAISDRVHEFRGGVPARDDQLLLEIAYHGATAQTT